MRPGAHAAAQNVARNQEGHSQCVRRSGLRPREPAAVGLHRVEAQMDELSTSSLSSGMAATHETALRRPPQRLVLQSTQSHLRLSEARAG
eukprot:4310380-Heterocapsa_arctica.AAC.1